MKTTLFTTSLAHTASQSMSICFTNSFKKQVPNPKSHFRIQNNKRVFQLPKKEFQWSQLTLKATFLVASRVVKQPHLSADKLLILTA